MCQSLMTAQKEDRSQCVSYPCHALQMDRSQCVSYPCHARYEVVHNESVLHTMHGRRLFTVHQLPMPCMVGGRSQCISYPCHAWQEAVHSASVTHAMYGMRLSTMSQFSTPCTVGGRSQCMLPMPCMVGRSQMHVIHAMHGRRSFTMHVIHAMHSSRWVTVVYTQLHTCYVQTTKLGH